MSISFDLTIDDTRDQLARHVRANMEQKPSLIGMSREEMADELIKVGVLPKQVKMRIA
jgi:23S rRNA (adenine2503-C2)-methyltransferase